MYKNKRNNIYTFDTNDSQSGNKINILKWTNFKILMERPAAPFECFSDFPFPKLSDRGAASITFSALFVVNKIKGLSRKE